MNLSKSLCILLLVSVATAQQWSGVLPPERAMNWSGAGVIGGIPARTVQCGPTIPPSGQRDITDANAINRALQNCANGTYSCPAPPGCVVQLDAGTFYIVHGLTFGSPTNTNGFTVQVNNVTLKGKGPMSTKLVVLGPGVQECGGFANSVCVYGDNSITLGSTNASYAGSCAWTGGLSKGSTVLTLTNCIGGTLPQQGQIIMLDQRNDDIGILGCTTPNGTTATCTVSGSALPSSFAVGACVAVGPGGTATSPGPIGGFATSALLPATIFTVPTGCNAITAVSAPGVTPPTFSYVIPTTTVPLPSPTTCPSNADDFTKMCQASVDTGGTYVTGIRWATSAEYLDVGRACPDAKHPPTCDGNEISYRSQAQVVQVVSVNPGANQVTISDPVFPNNFRSSQEPGVWWFPPNTMPHDIGIEDMTLDNALDVGTTSSAGIYFRRCFNCWVRNIRSLIGSMTHIYAKDGVSHITVRDSYFFGQKGGGSQSYSVSGLGVESDFLIENNVMINQIGAVVSVLNGSVVGYNFMMADGSTSSAGALWPMLNMNHDVSGWNLFEANNTPMLLADNIHGTQSGPNTVFRARVRGQNTPAKNSNMHTVNLNAFSRGFNFVGSVLGTIGLQIAPYYQTCRTSDVTCIYQNDITSESNPPIPNDTKVTSSMLRWGNYDTATGDTRWCGNSSSPGWSTICGSVSEIPGYFFGLGTPGVPSTQNLPASFYLPARPSWWATAFGTPRWPAIGPDVTGGNNIPQTCGAFAVCGDDSSGHSDMIPTQLVQANMPLDTTYLRADTVTAASWSASPSPARITLTGSFTVPVGDILKLSNMNPSTYNGIYQVYATDAPTTGAYSGVYAEAGLVLPYGNYLVGYTRVTPSGGESLMSSAPGVQMTVNCPTSGNCQFYMVAPCAASASCLAAGSGPNTATGYNVYVSFRDAPTPVFCKQNSTPIPLTPATNWHQTFPILSPSNPPCVQPPVTPTAVSTWITALVPTSPGASATGGTIQSPLIQVFDANQYYGVAAATTPSVITGVGKLQGQGVVK